MTSLETVFQVFAWALWYQQELAKREWLEPDSEFDLGCWSFDDETWRAWLLDNAHLPPKPIQVCGCGTHRQLCVRPWRAGKGYSASAFTEIMKHFHPEVAIEATAYLKHPLFTWLDG